MQRDDRPPHLIDPADVPTWLADSVNRRVTYHNTTPTFAAGILRNGVRIDRSRVGSFGQGFYTATAPEPFFGTVSLTVAIRLRTPLVGHLDDVEALFDDLMARASPGQSRMTPTVGQRARRELLDEGYDGLMVGDAGGDGIDYVIAILDDSVRIVVED